MGDNDWMRQIKLKLDAMRTHIDERIDKHTEEKWNKAPAHFRHKQYNKWANEYEPLLDQLTVHKTVINDDAWFDGAEEWRKYLVNARAAAWEEEYGKNIDSEYENGFQ